MTKFGTQIPGLTQRLLFMPVPSPIVFNGEGLVEQDDKQAGDECDERVQNRGWTLVGRINDPVENHLYLYLQKQNLSVN